MLLLGFTHTDTTGLNRPGHPTFGVIAILFGEIAWTIGSLFSKYRSTDGSLLMKGSIHMLATSIVCLFVSFVAGEWRHFSFTQVSANSIIALVYLASAGSIVAYLSYLYLLQIRPPAQVSTHVYVNPLIAVLLGAIIAHERIGLLQVIALIIILCGVLLVNIPTYKKFRYPKAN
jgi:drug/metabolite transporter (DMT)-like permease